MKCGFSIASISEVLVIGSKVALDSLKELKG
jgi:hypothetical protein